MGECGIYCITCTANGKKYVGSTSNMTKRWSAHRVSLLNGGHKNQNLQNSWNKYGALAFDFSILEICGKEKLLERELAWVSSMAPAFNVMLPDEHSAGFSHSPETIKKFSEMRKGQKASPVAVAKRAAAMRGRKRPLFSDEWRKNIGNAGRGRKMSEENKKKMSERQKGKKRPPFSQEWRDKLAYAARNMSQAQRDKLAEIGRNISDETRKKMSDAKKGKPAWNKGLKMVKTNG